MPAIRIEPELTTASCGISRTVTCLSSNLSREKMTKNETINHHAQLHIDILWILIDKDNYRDVCRHIGLCMLTIIHFES